MKCPRPFHLPPSTRRSAWCALEGTGLSVPALRPADATATWQALETAAAVWRERPVEGRLDLLAQVLQELRARGPGSWREVLVRSTGLSPQGLDAAWEVTFAPHTRESLEEALQAESLDASKLRSLAVAGRLPERLVHVVSGNVFPASLSVLLRGWILGAAQWLRPAAREPLWAACLLEDLQERAPELAACTAVLWWPHDARELEAAVLGVADAVTVQGSDASLAALEAKRSQWTSRPTWIAYGSRWSAACVSAASQVQETASGLARDVALFDQQGCLSPTLVFAERGPALQEWCNRLAASLAAEETRMPRGELPARARAALRYWHENRRLGVALGDVAELWEDGLRWAVTLRSTCTLDESPLDRHVIVVPFEDWREIVAAAGESLEKLQGLVLAGEGWDAAAREALLEGLRPSRIAPAGRLQEAPLRWPQDHRAPFGSLLRPV